MRYVITLATIPVVIWAMAPRSGPVVASVVEPEGYTARRMDDETFRARFNVTDMPPMREIVTEPLLIVSHETPKQTRKVALRTDVCSRHGLRKVTIGKRWRCRR